MISTDTESSSQSLQPHVVELLHKIARNEGIIEPIQTASDGSKHGDGFLSSVIRVLIAGRDQINASKTLSVIVKVPPSDPQRREEFASVRSFRSEAIFYSRVALAFSAFEQERRIPTAERLQIPRCLATLCDDRSGQYAIVLEDLRSSGWQLRDKFSRVDQAHGERVAEGLARFHGISLAFRDQKPEEFREFAEMESSFLRRVEEQPEKTNAMFGRAWQRALNALDDSDADLKRKFQAACKDFITIVGQSLRSAPAEPRRVIGHSDFWNNNMMFEYDEHGQPVRICLFDFQDAKLQSPVLDVITYLLLSTDKAYRDAHMSSFLRHYHKTLSAVVRRLGSDPDQLMTWSDFEADMRRYAICIVLQAPFMLQVTTAAAEDVRRNEQLLADGTVDTNVFYCESTNALYEERVRDVLRLADEMGLFAGYE